MKGGITIGTLNYFTWNGVDSRTKNIYVINTPSITVPHERNETIDIPGRNGTLARFEGEQIYSNIDISLNCFIDVPMSNWSAAISEAANWLRGEGKLKIPSRQNGYYKARVSSDLGFTQLLSGNDIQSLGITFTAYPTLFIDSGDTEIAINSFAIPYQLHNAGTMFSQPLITVTGAGDCTIMCAGSTMLLEDVGSTYGYLCVDCENKIIYSGTKDDAQHPLVPLGTHATGDWLTIPTGNPYITITPGTDATISSVKIIPRWRCL